METNKQKLNRLGIETDADTVMDAYGDSCCEICNNCISKNLSPSNPSCEGRWCEEAVEIWLDEPAEAEDVSDGE